MTVLPLLSGRRIAIVGAGLVGSMLAIILARRGARVDVFEKRPDLRRSNIPGGRTIVMSLSERGWHALAQVGLDESLRQLTIPKVNRTVHATGGQEQEQPYGDGHDAIWTVDRKELNCLLMDAAPDSVTYHFEQRLVGLDPDGPTVTLEHRELGRQEQRYDHVIGADGLFSRTRGFMVERGLVREDFITLDYGYRELSLAPGPDGSWVLPERSVHIWPGEGALFIALPNRNHSFTCSLFYHKQAGHAFSRDVDSPEAMGSFRSQFPGAAAHIPDLQAELQSGKPSDICAVRCNVWNHEDKVLLMGDAAHAIVPFFAMGMNTGFEDCTDFAAALDACDGDLGTVIQQYTAARKPHTDAIGAMSLENFQSIGCSDDRDYHRRWHHHRRLWQRYPGHWYPLYVMIAFSRIPLAEVQRRHAVQEELLDLLLNEFGLDLDDAGLDEIDRRLVPLLRESLPAVDLDGQPQPAFRE